MLSEAVVTDAIMNIHDSMELKLKGIVDLVTLTKWYN